MNDSMRMCRFAPVLFGLLLVCAGAGAAAAELQIAVGPRDCDKTHTDAKGRPAFTYAVTWPSGSATPDTFLVNTGNQCRLGQAVCGVSNDACRVVCAGQCSATLVACPFGTAAWVQVGNQARTLVSRRVSAAGPASKCR